MLSITEEALENAHRHAGARRVEVRAGVEGDVLTVVVRDDGTGMPGFPAAPDLEGLRRAGHFGLVGMAERAASVGARLSFGRGERGAARRCGWSGRSCRGGRRQAMTGEPNPFGEAPPPDPLRVVVADDNPVVRAGLTALLSGREDLEVVAEAADGREAYEATLAHTPDVVLLDVRMPGVDGLTALPHLVPLTAVLMLTYSGESDIVHEALRRGANGYLVHGEFTPDELVTAVRDARRGGRT